MKTRVTGLVLFVVLFAAAICHIAHYYPMLPDRVASHFNAAGEANGWSGKQAFATLYLVIIAVMALLFLGIPRLVGKLPASMVNLPNREYWLAPERKAETVAILSHYMAWLGSAMLVFLIFVFHLTIRANLAEHAKLGREMWIGLGAFLLYTTAWCIALLLRFRKPPESGQS